MKHMIFANIDFINVNLKFINKYKYQYINKKNF